jgi:chromosome segregation ATPase
MDAIRFEINDLEEKLSEIREVMENLKKQLTPVETGPLKEKVASLRKLSVSAKQAETIIRLAAKTSYSLRKLRSAKEDTLKLFKELNAAERELFEMQEKNREDMISVLEVYNSYEDTYEANKIRIAELKAELAAAECENNAFSEFTDMQSQIDMLG